MANLSNPEISFLPVAWKLEKTLPDSSDKCNLMFYWDSTLAESDQEYNTLYHWNESENKWEAMPAENTTSGSSVLVYLGMEGPLNENIFTIGPKPENNSNTHSETDTDGDGVPDAKDAFPLDPRGYS